MIRLVVSGCCGKMGKRILALASKNSEFEVCGALERGSHPDLGKKVSTCLGLANIKATITDNLEVINKAEVLIEFTTPAATMEHLNSALKYKKPMVIGSTGLDEQQLQKIQQACAYIPIVYSPNMSLGVNLLFRIASETAKRLGDQYKVDIIEAHHVHKKDSPSGTAKRLSEIIVNSGPWKKGEIPIKSVREDEIVGDHQVRFDGPDDTITMRHSAKTRDIFVQGALQAAKFLVDKSPGLYGMQNVIEDK
ncbi:MAG: 4-hydroxy-tetrahydrodipicolinate reductase [Candidatus Omnitrophica bacterium]|nr:4-hydroxy-tetrahydrodipicolinate reductase [Candidatus Omnitrophota bacterium]